MLDDLHVCTDNEKNKHVLLLLNYKNRCILKSKRYLCIFKNDNFLTNKYTLKQNILS